MPNFRQRTTVGRVFASALVATAVSVGTAVFHDPSAPARVSRELADALAARGIERLSDAVGLAHRPAPEPTAEAVAEDPAEGDESEPGEADG